VTIGLFIDATIIHCSVSRRCWHRIDGDFFRRIGSSQSQVFSQTQKGFQPLVHKGALFTATLHQWFQVQEAKLTFKLRIR